MVILAAELEVVVEVVVAVVVAVVVVVVVVVVEEIESVDDISRSGANRSRTNLE